MAPRSSPSAARSAAEAQVTAELVLLLDEHNRGSRLGCPERGGHSSRATPGDQHVGMRVPLVVGTVGSIFSPG